LGGDIWIRKGVLTNGVRFESERRRKRKKRGLPHGEGQLQKAKSRLT